MRDVEVAMRKATLDYQRPDTHHTLRSGLEEYHGDIGVYDAMRMNPKSAFWFRVHDAVHVVFGCNTTPEQEALTSTWTMFGTDWHWSEAVAEGLRPDQRDRFMRDIFGNVGYGRMTFLVFATLPGVIEVARRARAMSRKWAKEDYERYLDVPLVDIRSEFGIEVYQQ
ncbi:hypothetical protein ACNOYE_35750 [Nannocystaceae bacterium ST9]